MLHFNESQTLSTATNSATSFQQLTQHYMWDATCSVTNTTPDPTDFVYLSGNNFTAAAHGFLTGLKGEVSTTGTLPTGLTDSTDYWVIVINANTFALAATLEDALAGTAVAISGAGTGVQTFTASALAGTLVFQKTNQPSNVPNQTYEPWHTITTPTTAATQNVTADGVLNYYDIQAGYAGLRALLTVTGGQASVVVRINGKGI